MDDLWSGSFWVLKIWLCLVISLIMIPAMFGFSLGISEAYMTVLVKTLEVLLVFLVVFTAVQALGRCCQPPGLERLMCVLLFCSGPLWRCRRQKQMSRHFKPLHLMVSRKLWGCSREIVRIVRCFTSSDVFVISSIMKDGLVVTNISCAATFAFHKILYDKSERVVMKLLRFERVVDLTVQFGGVDFF